MDGLFVGDNIFRERIPSIAVGAFAEPLGLLGAALAANKNGFF
jgi:hypothetical protein